jgi:hypothetical protein
MQSKSIFSKLWPQSQHGADTPENGQPTEVPMNKPDVHPAADPAAPHAELLSCEDIYRASGILGLHSKYGISKIAEMLNSKHVRELSKEVKRASVLMALDAVGTSVDEVLQDATRRQHALNTYEAGRRKEIDELEADKLRENVQIQAELERVTAHYADRIKRNLDLVEHEKEAFRGWQTIKEQESLRISEASALCGKQPVAESVSDAPAGPVAVSDALAPKAATAAGAGVK